MDLEDIHPKDEQDFKNAVSRDLAEAVGGDASKVRVLALERGSIRVHTALDPGVCGDQDPLNVARDLAQQATDPNSALKKGRFTSAATGATVSIAAKSALALPVTAFCSRQSQQGGGADARAKLLAPFGGGGEGSLTGGPPGSPLLQAKHMPLTVCIRLPKGVAGQACNSPKVIVVNKSYAAPNADVSEMVHAGQVCALVKTGTSGWILIMAYTGKLTWFPSSFATTFPEFSYTHPGLPPPRRAGSSSSLSSLDKYESSCTTASGIYLKTQRESARERERE